jgi:NADPH-dependent 2,4-dienoyl-CoA reductase/sulfur reductase-like enzyme
MDYAIKILEINIACPPFFLKAAAQSRRGGKAMVDAAVLIVGCGPTGLIAAHELLRRGISYRLVANLCARRTAAMARVRWFWCVPTFVGYVGRLADVEGLSGHMQQHWLA